MRRRHTALRWGCGCRPRRSGSMRRGRASASARYGPLDQVAWYSSNSGGETKPVATKLPNAWGLYDMLGNVWEWVSDWYDEAYYAKKAGVDPPGPANGTLRVLRGGSWVRRIQGSSVSRTAAGTSQRSGYLQCRLSVCRGSSLGFASCVFPLEEGPGGTLPPGGIFLAG